MMKVAFNTLGCKVNQYETDMMRAKFIKAGYKWVEFKDVADIYVVNTCTVTNMADKKSRQILARAKKNNPKSLVVAVGCYVQTSEADLQKMPYIDLLIGNQDKNIVVEIVESYLEKKKSPSIKTMAKYHVYEEDWAIREEGDIRVHIKIQDGCNQFCAFCIIPFTRGRIRSRGKESILKEVKSLVCEGRREIVLTGIHLASYGEQFDQYGLVDLLEDLNKIENLDRIRLGSLEPSIVTENFVQRISNLEKLCPHFHLSLQSGSDIILKRMNRHYQVKDFLEATRKLRQMEKECGITTDLIVGFPGETDELFEETLNFLEQIKFLDVHVFKYSKRDGTKAANMEEQIDGTKKNERSKKAVAVAKKHKKIFISQYINQDLIFLVEEQVSIDGNTYLVGYTMNYIKIYMPFKEKNSWEEKKKVRILHLFRDGLLGESID